MGPAASCCAGLLCFRPPLAVRCQSTENFRHPSQTSDSAMKQQLLVEAEDRLMPGQITDTSLLAAGGGRLLK